MHAEHPAGLRAGWRWIAAALLALLVLSTAIGQAHAARRGVVGDCTPGSDWGTLNQAAADQVLALVNQHRTAMGLTALAVSPTLTKSANWKSLHMSYYRYMSHDDPGPPAARTTADRLQTCGYPIGSVGWGENIASGYASPDAVMTAWLNSPGHRANIENASFRAIGIGVVITPSGTYWTQNFGTLADGGAWRRRDDRREADRDLHAEAEEPAVPADRRVDDDRLADERHVHARRRSRDAVHLAAHVRRGSAGAARTPSP